MEVMYFNEAYLQFVFANSAAPVVAKLKPSGLMTIWKHYFHEFDFRRFINENGIEQLAGCRCEIMLETPLYYLIFCYQTDKLEQELEKNHNSDILYDYVELIGIEEKIQYLKEKIVLHHKSKIEFPHEIGLFLGYPVWDVEGFIKNRGLNYKLCGYWKVYEDLPGAISKFEQYDRVRKDAIIDFRAVHERNNLKIQEKRYSV